MINIFEGLFTDEVGGARKAIFEGGFKFADSEARNKFDGRDSASQIKEGRSASPSTQEYQILEGKMNQN